MNVTPTEPTPTISIQVDTEKSIFSAHHEPVLVHGRGRECILYHSYSVVHHLLAAVHGPAQSATMYKKDNHKLHQSIRAYNQVYLSGNLFFLSILWSSLRATTHFVFSDSESASMRHWCLIPGGSIRLVVTRKIQGTSFLAA